MKRMGISAVALAAAMSLAACGPADDRDRIADGTGVTTGTTDDRTGIGVTGGAVGDVRDAQEFAQTAAEKNLAEIELGRLAQQRATDPQVREFAQMMVQDHTKSLEELRQSAQRENIQITEQLSDDARQMQERLQGLSGAEFDREYMRMMVDGHEEMHDLLEDRAGRVDQRATGTPAPDRPAVGTTGVTGGAASGEVNRWAAGALPTVEQHHQRAQQIHERLDNGTAAR